jgi:hypothetical protein
VTDARQEAAEEMLDEPEADRQKLA